MKKYKAVYLSQLFDVIYCACIFFKCVLFIYVNVYVLVCVCVWMNMCDERIHVVVFLAHLQPPLVAVNQPLQPLAIYLRRLLGGAQTATMFT